MVVGTGLMMARLFCVVGNTAALVNSKVDKIFNMAEDLQLAEIIDMQIEISVI